MRILIYEKKYKNKQILLRSIQTIKVDMELIIIVVVVIMNLIIQNIY